VTFGRRKDDHLPLTSPLADPAASVWLPRAMDRNPDDNGQYGIALRYLAKDFNSTEFGFYFMNYHSRTPFVSGHTGTPSTAFGTPTGSLSNTVTSALTGTAANAGE
jgi:hypothetical protein